MAVPAKTEQAVRRYLEFVQGDGVAVGRARSLASRATDPMVKLRALTKVENASTIEAGFIEHAATFAAAENVPVNVWRELGVSDETLQKAGLLSGSRPRKAAARTAKRATKSAGKKKAAPRPTKVQKRAARLDLDTVIGKLPKKEFKVRELSERIERPIATTRNYLDRLVEAKAVKIVGEDKSGRGKPAKIYQKV